MRNWPVDLFLGQYLFAPSQGKPRVEFFVLGDCFLLRNSSRGQVLDHVVMY